MGATPSALPALSDDFAGVCRVAFLMPLVPLSLEAQPRPASGEAFQKPVGARFATVLVVDDEATDAAGAAEAPGTRGYRVLCAVDGEEP